MSESRGMKHITVSDVVKRAISHRAPVVALETTLITHGLPRGEGLDVALGLEREIMNAGAVPATVGVYEGKIHVGLEPAHIERLAAERAPAKLNLSNLASVLARHESGSTTVAATMYAAAQVGIEVFATGGIGGVHRDVTESGDVSSDLMALARYPVAVVCAGAKAVLDLGKTREALETLGVPIFGFRTNELPAFYRRSSGIAIDQAFDDIAELAASLRTHFDLGLRTGAIVANPILPEYEMPLDLYERSLAVALTDAERAGPGGSALRGRSVTPFLLERLQQLTEGKSVFSNRALLLNNAKVAAQIAVSLARLG